MHVVVVVAVVAAALGGFPCRCNVHQCTPASSSIEGEGEGEGEGEEEFMGRHRVFGRMGPSLTFTQAMVGHKWFESHPSADSQTQAPTREQDTSKRARGSLKPFSPGYRNAITSHTTSCISVCTRSSVSYPTHAAPTAVIQSSWGLRVHADVDRRKRWGAGKRSDGIREAGAGHADPHRG